jgi:DNA polymerase III alpha subunit (gram-positive type)
MLAADLERAKERRQLLEDQLQQRHYMNVQTKQVNSSVDYESDKKAQSKIKEELAKLRQELASERSKKQELEELVEKNLLLYEHECEKTTTLQKEWQKEKASAMHYKKRYTRNKETNEKQKKLIRELENSVKELHTKVQGLEVAKEAVITKEVKRKALVNLSISKQSNSILNTTLDQLDQDKKSNLNDSMQSGQWITLKNRASLVSLQ